MIWVWLDERSILEFGWFFDGIVVAYFWRQEPEVGLIARDADGNRYGSVLVIW